MGAILRGKFKDLKLSKKMLLVYMILSFFTFLIAATALQVSLKIYDKQLYGKSQQELDFFSQQVNDNLNEIEEISMSIATGTDVQAQLKKLNSIDYISSEYYYELQQLRSLLQNKIISHSNIKNVIYADSKDVKITVGQECGIISEDRMNNILKDFSAAGGAYVFYSPDKEYPYMLSGRDVREVENATLNYMGSLIFTSDIAQILEEKTDTLQAEHSNLFVYSEKGMIYQEMDTEGLKLPGMDSDRGYDIIKFKGTKMFMCYEKSIPTGWMYVNIFPYSEIFGQITLVREIMFGIFAVMFLITVFVLRKIAKVITRPLEQLYESMQIVEDGDFQAAKIVIRDVERQDEVGMLTREFRVMLDKIDTLIHENYEKQLLLQETKYKMLQAQINPHFLYNTLNALNWMVRGEKNRDAVKMIMELGKLLRASFAKDPYTTVKEEIQTAQSYMVIQKFRYQNRVEFETEISGNMESYMVPRMILQPLIENSVYYGVEQSPTCCKIKVEAIEQRDQIILRVEDEGPGMNAEELDEVRKGIVKAKGHGIGLKNIRERLKMTYKNSEFYIESKHGEGTRIEIRIPKEEGKHV